MSETSKYQRKHRHETCKKLLVLDYIIETIGSVFIGIAYFVSNKSILQEYILGTCCIMIYAVPIPISYLINESRVKDTIISKGWLEGFKSIFYSEEKIRHIRRQDFISEFVSITTIQQLKTIKTL